MEALVKKHLGSPEDGLPPGCHMRHWNSKHRELWNERNFTFVQSSISQTLLANEPPSHPASLHTNSAGSPRALALFATAWRTLALHETCLQPVCGPTPPLGLEDGQPRAAHCSTSRRALRPVFPALGGGRLRGHEPLQGPLFPWLREQKCQRSKGTFQVGFHREGKGKLLGPPGSSQAAASI